MATVIKCRNCGADNPDDAILCGGCGATLPAVSSPRAASIVGMSIDKGSTLFYVVGIYLGILSIMMPLAYVTNSGAIQGFSVIVWILGGIALLRGWWLSPG